MFQGRKHQPIRQALILEPLEDRTLLSAGGSGAVIDLSGLSVDPSHYSSTDILVRFQTLGANSAPASVLAGTAIGQKMDLVPGLYQVRLSSDVSVAQALAAYRATANVLEAEPDYKLTVSQVPNDPQFNQQWDLRNTGQNGGAPGADIHAPQAWDVTTGNGKIVVAVNDTGIDYNHPELFQNIWINQAEIPKSRLQNLVDVYHDGYISFRDLNNPVNIGPGKITDVNQDGRIDAGDILAPMILDQNGRDTGLGGWAFPGNTQDGDTAHPNDFIGWNFVNNSNNPFDDNGHGTHVSGTIGAAGNNGVGVAGIDWQVQLMPIKFLGADGQGAISDFIDGLSYEIAHGARMSNNSWEGAPFSQVLQDAVANTRQHGQIFVAAAGNGGANTDQMPNYPSGFRLDNVVAVAASDKNDNLAGFSNWGPQSVALAAPGVDILSTMPGGNYDTRTGTSMATPHVTGALALVWGLHPDWSYAQVINRVLSTVDKLPGLQGKVASGGRLNVAAAVAGVTPPTITSPPVTPPPPVAPPPHAAPQTFTFTNGSSSAIPDRGLNVSLISVPQDLTIGQVQVRLNIAHSDDSDLYVHLQAPDGTDVLLVNRRGGTGQNFQNTLFNDQSANSIIDGKAPFSSAYRPEVALNNLKGKNARGTWKLWIEDRGTGHSGTVTSWSLIFTPAGTSSALAQASSVSTALASVPPVRANSIAPNGTPPTSGPSRSDQNGDLVAAALTAKTSTAPPPTDKVFASAGVMTRVRTDLLVGKRSPSNSTNGWTGESDG